MEGWLKTLIAAACVAVIATSGLFWWKSHQDAARADAERQRIQAAHDMVRKAECRRYIEQWDTGDKLPVIDEFGENAEKIILSCRLSVD